MAQPANANATSEPSQPSSSALPELPWQPLVRTFEPYASLLRPNFHTGAKTGLGVQEADLHALKDSPTPGLDLNDQDLYYNTERDEEAYWKGTNLPVPTKDPAQMRRDLMKWGYCLVAEALSPAQLDAIRTRIYEQADGERLAGVASLGASMPRPGEQVSTTQLVHSLLNKGDIFRRLLEFEAEVTQGGKMIEQMLVDVLGDNFLISTFLSLITEPGNIPQNLHQDQVLMPYQTPQGPVSCNTMYFLDDFNRTTGSTLVIPGSHLLMPKSIPMKEPLPPPVNVVGPAGTCLIFEGRLIHGTGVNKGTSRRAALIMDSRMPFMRPQELFPLSLAPDVMMRLSPKSLARLGFRPTGMGGAEGTFRDSWQTTHRLAIARGEYIPIRHLSPSSPHSDLTKDYTWRHTEAGAFLGKHQKYALPEIKEGNKERRARDVPGKLEGVATVPGVASAKIESKM